MAHSIQANLYDFLQRLRLSYGAVTLWVDALCINQNDTLEKNVQVPLMGLIFSYAKSVFIWLGPHADGSEEYFDSCNQTTSQSQSLRSRILENVDLDSTNHISAAIASLQRRRYWTRTWIIQEIVLASDIHLFCGNRDSNWPNFIFHMPDQDTDSQAIGMSHPTHTFGKLIKLRNIAERLTLRQLLFQCHMSRCSDPRDLIYSLLNIAKDTNHSRSSIVADYSCSLETLFLQSMSCCPLPQAAYDGISAIPCQHVLGWILDGLSRVQRKSYNPVRHRPWPRSWPLDLTSRNSLGLVVLSHGLLLWMETHCRIQRLPRQKTKPSNLSQSIPSVESLERQRYIRCGASTSSKQPTLSLASTSRARTTQASALPASADQYIAT